MKSPKSILIQYYDNIFQKYQVPQLKPSWVIEAADVQAQGFFCRLVFPMFLEGETKMFEITAQSYSKKNSEQEASQQALDFIRYRIAQEWLNSTTDKTLNAVSMLPEDQQPYVPINIEGEQAGANGAHILPPVTVNINAADVEVSSKKKSKKRKVAAAQQNETQNDDLQLQLEEEEDVKEQGQQQQQQQYQQQQQQQQYNSLQAWQQSYN